MELTAQQNDFIKACAKGGDNLLLNAVAGSGKTMTMVEAVKVILEDNPYLDVICCAFNARIAKELTTRMPPLAKCKTMHSLGYAAWARHISVKKIELNKWKVKNIIDDLWPEKEDEENGVGELHNDVLRLVGLVKCLGLVPTSINRRSTPLIPDEVEVWQEIMDVFDLDYEPYGLTTIISMTTEVLERSIEDAFNGTIDFDDMLYMPICFGATFYKNDIVMIDEAQDISAIQRKMLHQMLKDSGRLYAIGDRNQAIYAFRGAAYDSIDLIGSEFKCTEFPLTYSFRCPKSIIKEAQKYVPHIQSAPGAPIGSVKHLSIVQADNFTQKDVIICRNTRPLIDMAFSLIYRGVGCYVLGSEMGKNLISLIRRLSPVDVEDLYKKAKKFSDERSRALINRGKEEKAFALRDRVGSLLSIIDGMEPNSSIDDVRQTINTMFSEKKHSLTLSTIHKAKGLEWPRVFFLDSDLIPSKYATQDWQLQQEENLYYVAVTRAQEELVFIKSGGFEKD